MAAAARIEIITAAAALPALRERLDAAGAPGYSTFEHVTGRGRHGSQRDDDIAGGSANVCLIVICEPAQVDGLAAAARPLLERFGGICTVGDVRRVLD